MANLFELPRYIAVEGPIRVGKSTLARILAERLNAQRVMEPEANPFLDAFYEGERGAAFQAQFAFLVRRFEQLQALDLGSRSQKIVVADYIFEKDKIFANLNLADPELETYDRYYKMFRNQVPTPDLVIYLQASVETLVHRVRKRGNPIEHGITEDYLRALDEAYTRYFHGYGEGALLIVNSEKLNFVDNPDHLDLLVERIQKMRGGREFFNRA